MTFLDAAFVILREAEGPLHYAEIAARAVAGRLLETRGLTPEATMGSRLYVDTKRPDSRFRRAGRGVFTLAEPEPHHVAVQINRLNRQTRAEIRQRLLSVPADRFETLVGELLVALGFDESTVKVTRFSGDAGIDVRGLLRVGRITEVNAAVQVKRWKRNVHARAVRDLRGSLVVHEQGILITTSDFSSGARKEAEAEGKTRISLVNGDDLLDLLIRHGIGVSQEQHSLLSLDEEWWDEVSGEEPPTPTVPPPVKQAEAAVMYPLPVRASVRGQTLDAELLDATGRMRYEGSEYGSPSAAGQVATGWKSCNGWVFWRYQDAETGEWQAIADLRSSAASGR